MQFSKPSGRTPHSEQREAELQRRALHSAPRTATSVLGSTLQTRCRRKEAVAGPCGVPGSRGSYVQAAPAPPEGQSCPRLVTPGAPDCSPGFEEVTWGAQAWLLGGALRAAARVCTGQRGASWARRPSPHLLALSVHSKGLTDHTVRGVETALSRAVIEAREDALCAQGH